MTLAPVWRTRLAALGATLVAVWMGSAIAYQELAGPAVCIAALLGLVILRVQPQPLTTVLLAALVCGYVIGNRGFAQLSPSAALPLLPAELVLAAACTIFAVQCALTRQLPWRAETLNHAVLAWLAVGAGRLIFDVRPYGFIAVRDFALVYYAVFFFLAQQMAGRDDSLRFVHRCLAGSCAVLLVTATLFDRFPGFFLETLTFRDIPLIYYKGDLAGTFMAVGAVLFFVGYERSRSWWQLGLSLALTAGMLASQNRASMLGLIVAGALLTLGGRWRFAAIQAGTGVLVALTLLLAASFSHRPWQQTALYSVYERAVSLFDPLGNRSYTGESTLDKGDNNRFRAVWWSAVIDETLDGNPWLGLGFGHDLAQRFVREYYPNNPDEFTTRSPHNVAITVFARMGLLGLLPFLAIAGLMLARTLRAIRRGPSMETALWCSAWVILTSACFGVVLEGPMGAVVFWIVAGTANAARLTAPVEKEAVLPAGAPLASAQSNN